MTTKNGWSGHHMRFAERTRRAILTRDPLCRCPGCPHCTPTGCTQPSTEADHITPTAEGGPNTAANGQGMCTECHHHKTRAEQRRGLNRWKRKPEPHPGIMGVGRPLPPGASPALGG